MCMMKNLQKIVDDALDVALCVARQPGSPHPYLATRSDTKQVNVACVALHEPDNESRGMRVVISLGVFNDDKRPAEKEIVAMLVGRAIVFINGLDRDEVAKFIRIVTMVEKGPNASTFEVDVIETAE